MRLATSTMANTKAGILSATKRSIPILLFRFGLTLRLATNARYNYYRSIHQLNHRSDVYTRNLAKQGNLSNIHLKQTIILSSLHSRIASSNFTRAKTQNLLYQRRGTTIYCSSWYLSHLQTSQFRDLVNV